MPHVDSDEGSYLASVSDLMSGLLFIFIITVLIFALQLRETEKKKSEELARLQGADETRRELLLRIKSDLERQNIVVEIDPDNGVLRLGESILFESGQDSLGTEGRDRINRLGVVLGRVLPCYSSRHDTPRPSDCGDRGKNGMLDAIFIEGHTDDIPLAGGGRFPDNWVLSTARARTVFLALTGADTSLDSLENQRQQPLFSLSGYKDRRGVVANDSDEHRRRNRRIDLRFVMAPPLELLPPPAEETRVLLQPQGGH